MADVKQLKEDRFRAKASITRRISHIDKLIEEKSDADSIQLKLHELISAKEEFEQKCQDYAQYSEDACEEDMNYGCATTDAVTRCIQRAGVYLSSVEGNGEAVSPSKQGSVRSHSSRVSRSSRASNASKASLSKRLAEAEKEAIEAKEELLALKQKYEKAKLELSHEKERGSLAIRSAHARGKLDTLRELEDDEPELDSDVDCDLALSDQEDAGGRPPKPTSNLRPTALEFRVQQPTEPVGEAMILAAIKENQTQQRQLMNIMNLPKVDLPKFDGNKLTFWTFINSFENFYENADDKTKLIHLINACEGKPKELITCCVGMKPKEGYDRARSVLQARYGNEFDMVQNWISKVTGGSPIKGNDGKGLQQLADDLRQCMEILNSVNKTAEMNSQTNLVKVGQRLPYHLQNKWRSKARKLKVENHRLPNFEDLVSFIEISAEEINDPVWGMPALSGKSDACAKENKQLQPQKGKSKVYNMQASKVQVSCKLCNGPHHLYQCEQFKSMSVEERYEYVKANRLCFKCLRSGCSYHKCTLKLKCNVDGCNKAHNRLLHRVKRSDDQQTHVKVLNDEPRDASIATPTSAKSADGDAVIPKAGKVECNNIIEVGSQQCIALPIVPVKVTTVGGHRSFVTYALLDSGSNSSFCSNHLARKLGIKGKREKLSLSTLTAEQTVVDIESIKINISDLAGASAPVTVNRVFVKPNMDIGKGCIAKQVDVDKWPHLRGIDIKQVDGCQVHLLIGQDAPQLLIPEEIRKGEPGSPYAIKTMLGWALNGPMTGEGLGTEASVHFTQTRDLTRVDPELRKMWQIEAPEVAYEMGKNGWSINDHKVIDLWDRSVKRIEGHYELPIPFTTDKPELPDNKLIAEKRLNSLKTKLSRDPDLRKKYTEEMCKLTDEGYAEIVPNDEINRSDGKVYYLPHFSVQSEKKPDKVRVVFDGACKSGDRSSLSLNDHVYQGPDLTNPLVGVLLRLRMEPVVIVGDIKAMFNQCHVTKDDRDVLRYLWWPNGDLHQPPQTYRMKTHLFGGDWSPAAANYILRRVAKDEGHKFTPDIADSICRDFYVDDYVKAVPDIETGIRIARDVTKLVSKGGFRLTKWISNSREVLDTIPEEERAENRSCVELGSNDSESVLGVHWNIHADELAYDVKIREKQATKRGILSIVNSIYDPLGLVSPFILQGKQILQELTRLKLDWDDPIPDNLNDKWQTWLDGLGDLRQMRIPRRVTMLDNIVEYQLNHFADASLQGVSVTSYLRTTDKDGRVDCKLIYARSKLTPLRPMTVPRLELTAATLAVKIDTMLKAELGVTLKESMFWSDSAIVLSYISNESKRFQVFVANRVAQIREKTDPNQWRFIPTELNPADYPSRGMSAKDLIHWKTWIQGPDFLKGPEEKWPRQVTEMSIPPEDPELKRSTVTCNVTVTDRPSPIALMREKVSSLFRLTKLVAWLLKIKKALLQRVRAKMGNNETGGVTDNDRNRLTIPDIRGAEEEILRDVQQANFAEEISLLKAGKPVSKGSRLRKLDPIFSGRLLRVGGRLKNANSAYNFKHPIILPRDNVITTMIIRQAHERVSHMGQEYTLAETRSKYWIIDGRRTVRKEIRSCLKCKKQHASVGKAKMADLPAERVTTSNFPFSATGIDCYGPYEIKRGRVMVKRYGCLFTCLKSRAVHLEVLHSLDTDSFIKALTRFINRRSRPAIIFCDNGSNFRSGFRVLKAEMESLDQKQIDSFCLKNDIQWRFNPPAAPHMGGVWERQVKTAKRLLTSLMGEQTLNDEDLLTLACQAEQIMNSRPLTRVSDDISDYEALTPNHLLLLRPDTDLPVGPTDSHDLYCKKRWRQIRYLSDKFWRRWTREYVTNLQLRSKWNKEYENFKVGDLVLVADDMCPRGKWPLGRVIECLPGKDERVRVVKVRTAKGVYTRSITKLCRLEAD